MRAEDEWALARCACRGDGGAWPWARLMGRWAMVGGGRLVDCGECLLGGVSRSPLLVEAKGTRSRDDFAVDMTNVVTEVVGVEDGDLFSVWEVHAKGY